MSGHSSRPDSRPQRRAHSSREEAKQASFFKRAAAALRTFIVISFAFAACFLKDYEMRRLFSRKNVKKGEKSCVPRKRRTSPAGQSSLPMPWDGRGRPAGARGFPRPCAGGAAPSPRRRREPRLKRDGPKRRFALRQNAQCKKSVESALRTARLVRKAYPFSASSRALR